MAEQITGTETALVLSGAVAKGAFEAGVLSVLAEHSARFPIRRIVGASSGALNAAVFALGTRAGRASDAARRLVELWRDRADWDDVFKWSLSDLIHLRGAGTQGNVAQLLEEAAAGYFEGPRSPVDLFITLTDLKGQTGAIGAQPATTFENVRHFWNEHFDSPSAWQRVSITAIGSTTLPVIYAPVDVPEVGFCLDGGIVNNTPIKQAIEGGIDRVIVVSTEPALIDPPHFPDPRDLHGSALLGEVINILVNERLYRDLREAESINERLAKLDQLVASGQVTSEAAQAVRSAFNWRPLEVIQIRPKEPLRGSSVSGFSRAELRAEYIALGVARAREILG